MGVSNGLWGKILPKKNGAGNGWPQKERRRAPRYRLDLPVNFQVYSPSQPQKRTLPVNARTYDISESGIGLLMSRMEYDGMHLVTPGGPNSEQCRLDIEIPFGKDPIRVKGQAVWYVQNSETFPPVFRVGVEFVELTAALKDKLHTFVSVCASAAGG